MSYINDLYINAFCIYITKENILFAFFLPSDIYQR